MLRLIVVSLALATFGDAICKPEEWCLCRDYQMIPRCQTRIHGWNNHDCNGWCHDRFCGGQGNACRLWNAGSECSKEKDPNLKICKAVENKCTVDCGAPWPDLPSLATGE